MLTGCHGEAQWWTPHDFHESKPAPTKSEQTRIGASNGIRTRAVCMASRNTTTILYLHNPGLNGARSQGITTLPNYNRRAAHKETNHQSH